MLAFREGERARLVSRSGRDSGLSSPEVLQALMALPIDWVLDCELTMPDEHGRPDWHALAPRTAMRRPMRIIKAALTRPARLHAFDLLALGGRDLRGMKLRDRLIALQELLASAPAIKLSEQWVDGRALYQAVIKNELEGIVGRKLDSLYTAGRSDCWAKVRAPRSRWLGRVRRQRLQRHRPKP